MHPYELLREKLWSGGWGYPPPPPTLTENPYAIKKLSRIGGYPPTTPKQKNLLSSIWQVPDLRFVKKNTQPNFRAKKFTY